MKTILTCVVCLASFAAYAQTKTTVDKAPSGKERSEAIVDTRTGTIVTHPGKDAPVKETRQGNKIKLDYDTKGQPAKENDTTYIIREPQSKKK